MCDYLKNKRIVNVEHYREELETKEKLAILSKRRGIQSMGVLFLQGKPQTRKANEILETIERFTRKFYITFRSYDLATSNFTCLDT